MNKVLLKLSGWILLLGMVIPGFAVANNCFGSITEGVVNTGESGNTGDGTTLYGTVISYLSAYRPYAGVYSFKAKGETAEMKAEGANKLLARYFSNAHAGAYINGDYCIYSVKTDLDGISKRNNITSIDYLIYDTKTWQIKVRSEIAPLFINCPTGPSAYDPSTKTFYVVTFNDNGTGNYLCKANPQNGYLTKIAPIEPIHALATNGKGLLYALGAEGILYTVDARTGTLKKIGESGTVFFPLSAVYDMRTGKLYVTARTEEGTGLFTVDTATGSATSVYSFPKAEKIVGLYIKDVTHPEAPASVSGLQVDVEGDSLDGALSFTAPAVTFGGNELVSASLEITYRVDNESPRNKTLQPGETFTEKRTFGQGEHMVYVQVKNEKGVSPTDSLCFFTGEEVPAAVKNLSIEIDAGGEAVLTWEAPSEGLHGRDFDETALNYKIARYPGGTTVKEGITDTHYSDRLPSEQYGNYYYSVTACAGKWGGGKAVSDERLYGDAYPMPFAENFDSQETQSYRSFIIKNSDDGSSSWNYSRGEMIARGEYAWLFTPALRLADDKTYKLTFKTRAAFPDMDAGLKIALCTSAEIPGQADVLLDLEEIPSPLYEEHAVTFRVPATDNYYIGFGKYKEFGIYLDDIRMVENSSVEAPAGVTEFTLKAAPLGELKTALSFKAPQKRINGETLSAVEKVEVYRNDDDKAAKVFEAPAAGEILQWTDANPPEGMNTYRVIAYNEKGVGAEVASSVYVGYDIPAKVTGLKASSKDYDAYLTWEAPTQGVHGGYVNPDELTYIVYRNFDGVGGIAQIDGGIQSTEYIDKNVVPELVQRLGIYVVAAYSDRAGLGESSEFSWTNVGHPWALPFSERLESTRFRTFFWYEEVIEGDQNTSDWAKPTNFDYEYGNIDIPPMEKDSCFLVYMNYTKELSHGRLHSPKFSMKGAVNPVFSFWMYHSTEVTAGDFYIETRLRVDDGEYIELGTFDVNDGTNGWKEHRIDIAGYNTETDHSNFSIDAYVKDDSYKVALDNFLVEDYLPNEMLISAITAPARLEGGSKGTVNITVRNGGRVDVPAYQVEFYKNGELQDMRNGEPLPKDSTAVYEFPVTATVLQTGEAWEYYAKVLYEEDMNPANNLSDTLTVEISVPVYPAVDDLAGEQRENNIVLNWTQPGIKKMKPLTEDFSAYEPFTIADLGEWTLVDGDKQVVYAIGDEETYYPHINEPGAYQIWNAGLLGYADEGVLPRSGKQCLASWASTGWSGNPDDEVGTPVNDDWLISPQVVGGTTLSFYCKQPDAASVRGKNEGFQVLTSSATKDTADFVVLETEMMSVKESWVAYSYTLPEDAKYFALRHTTGAFVWLIDDLSYVPYKALELKGYNLYRDRAKLTELSADITAYTDENPAEGKHEYAVTAVYDLGESALSNLLEITATGIEEIQNVYNIYGVNGKIVIRSGKQVHAGIYAVTGLLLSEVTIEGMVEIPLKAGVYLVKIGTATVKVNVK